MTTINLQDYAICSLMNSEVFLAVKRSDSSNTNLRQLEGIAVMMDTKNSYWYYIEQRKVVSLFDRELLVMVP